MHFERCAAADAAGERPLAERRGCWSAWLTHYQLGQPPERVAYAAARVDALDAGDAAATIPELSGPERSGPERSGPQLSGVAPPSVDAPVERWDRSPPSPAAERVGICAPICAPDWDECIARCTPGERDCATACDAEFQTCVRACP